MASVVNNTLYRFYAEDGKLLYIGQTANPGTRLAKHSVAHPWWRAVAKITLEHYTTPALVKEAERRAIANEQPYFNTAHNGVKAADPFTFTEADRLYKFPLRRDSLNNV